MITMNSALVEVFRENLISTTLNLYNSSQFFITSISKIHAHFRPQLVDSPYTDTIIIVQTSGVGSSYCYCEDPAVETNILGKDARFVNTESKCINIAALDAAYSVICPKPDIYCCIEGNNNQKAEARSVFIFSEIQRILLNLREPNPSIVMVGAVGNVLSELSRISTRIYATDLDPTLINTKMSGITIEDGTRMTLKRVSESNIALVTAMTLVTDTLSDILNTANATGTKIVIFAETGSNFAGEFLKLGVESVVSEEYPFYMFPGRTILKVYRST